MAETAHLDLLLYGLDQGKGSDKKFGLDSIVDHFL